MEPRTRLGTGEDAGHSWGRQQPRQLAWPQLAAPDARVVEGETKDTEEDEEDMLALDRGAVRASAGRGGGGEGDGVDVAGGAEDEEVGASAVEEAEAVVEGADDAVGDLLGRISVAGGLWWGVGSDGLHGLGMQV